MVIDGVISISPLYIFPMYVAILIKTIALNVTDGHL